MFGPSKNDLQTKIDDLISRVDKLEYGRQPDTKTIAEEAVKELLKRIDPKDLLDRILLAQGLTIDGLVKKAVRDCLREDGLPVETLNELRDVIGESLGKNLDYEKLTPTIAKEAAGALLEDDDFLDRVEEKVVENLGTEEFDSKVADRVARGLLDGDSSITDDVVEKVSDSVYENLDDDTLYPAIGEKVAAALQNHKG